MKRPGKKRGKIGAAEIQEVKGRLEIQIDKLRKKEYTDFKVGFLFIYVNRNWTKSWRALKRRALLRYLKSKQK